MTLPELVDLLKQTEYPVFYSHWTKSTAYPECPPPPYICYEIPDEPNFLADSKTYSKIVNVTVDLYTKIKDLAVEAKLEDLFNTDGIAWAADNVWVEKELLYEKTYYLGLVIGNG